MINNINESFTHISRMVINTISSPLPPSPLSTPSIKTQQLTFFIFPFDLHLPHPPLPQQPPLTCASQAFNHGHHHATVLITLTILVFIFHHAHHHQHHRTPSPTSLSLPQRITRLPTSSFLLLQPSLAATITAINSRPATQPQQAPSRFPPHMPWAALVPCQSMGMRHQLATSQQAVISPSSSATTAAAPGFYTTRTTYLSSSSLTPQQLQKKGRREGENKGGEKVRKGVRYGCSSRRRRRREEGEEASGEQAS